VHAALTHGWQAERSETESLVHQFSRVDPVKFTASSASNHVVLNWGEGAWNFMTLFSEMTDIPEDAPHEINSHDVTTGL
jgi:hypothetical protein